MSPSGRHVALLEVAQGIVEGHNYRVPPRASLVILDSLGNVVRRLEGDVQRYTWCGASRVALISGIYQETEMEFDATGAVIVNVQSGSVDSLPGRPRAMSWAPFDSSLYLAYPTRPSGYRVDKYDPLTGRVTTTTHKGLAFSADGQFYLSLPLPTEGEHPLTVFRTIDDTPVSRANLEAIGSPVKWLPSGGSHLLLVVRHASEGRIPQTPDERRRMRIVLNQPGQSAEHDYVVYDVASGRIVHRLRAEFPAWGAENNAVPILVRGHVSAITRP